jgi:raffinose/stachyose/melibiose transport system permease protein
LRKTVPAITVFKYIILSITALVTMIIPFWILVINSFKPLKEAQKMGLGLPHEWKIIENYSIVIKKGNFLGGLLNTILVTVISIFLILLFSSMASWIFARGKSRIFSVLYYISVSGILIPIAMIPAIWILKDLRIYGNYIGLILFYCGVFIPFSIFFITGFVKTIPIELEEAARIDGCSVIGIFFRIILPLLEPVIATVSIFLVLFIWNDFYTPFYLLNSSKRYTLTMGLFSFSNSNMFQLNWHLIFADIIIVSMPLIIFYFILQKRIVSGLMGGALKQ